MHEQLCLEILLEGQLKISVACIPSVLLNTMTKFQTLSDLTSLLQENYHCVLFTTSMAMSPNVRADCDKMKYLMTAHALEYEEVSLSAVHPLRILTSSRILPGAQSRR